MEFIYVRNHQPFELIELIEQIEPFERIAHFDDW